MRIIELEQGTDEWRDWRYGICTASDASVIMGCAPKWAKVKTWEDLRMVKAGLGEPVSAYTQKMFDHGHEKEVEAREVLGLEGDPACIECDSDIRFGASLDGLDRRKKVWHEIKSPMSVNSSLLRHLRDFGWPPDYVFWQLVHQAGAIEDDQYIGRLVVYVSLEHFEIMSINSERLLKDWPKLKAEWERFLRGEKQ